MTDFSEPAEYDMMQGGLQVRPVSSVPMISGMAMPLAVEQIRAWVLANFEAPGNSTPYDSEFGDYQYIWGGPYTADEIVETAFNEQASVETLAQASMDLDRASLNWVPHDNRIMPPDDDAEWDQAEWDRARWPDPVTAAHADMLAKIDAVERTLAEADASDGGIGHNRPPGPIDDTPLPPIDREELGRALALLKNQPVRPESEARRLALRAIAVIRNCAQAAGAWLAKKGEIATDEFAKSFGKKTGEMAAYALPGVLSALLAAATKWIGLW